MANEYVVTSLVAEVLSSPDPQATKAQFTSFAIEVLRTIDTYVPPVPRRGQTINVN
jgi:hypothetical protein